MTGPRSFLRIWIAALATLALAVVALNLLVDPYDVFGTPRIGGISLRKPGPKNHALLAKTYQQARARPVTVLIGSSCTHIGMDAAAADWPAAMRPVYKFGVPGGYATSTSLANLREAIGEGRVENAVVFLDFQNFFVAEQPAIELGEDDRRYRILADGTPNPHRPWQVASDMFLSLATMGALADSVKTVAFQHDPGLLDLAPNGSSSDADFSGAARADGAYALFAQKNDFEREKAARLQSIMAGWQGDLPNLDIVRDMITAARAHHVSLTLVIAPHHGDALEIYWRMGLWPRLEQLKTELAAIAAEGGVALWDFMDYSAFNVEAVPAAGDRRAATKWFWEPTHFKQALGNVMIRTMFPQGPDAAAFGARLTPETVGARNTQVRAQREARVCETPGTALLIALTRPLPSGCTAKLTRGPT